VQFLPFLEIQYSMSGMGLNDIGVLQAKLQRALADF